MKKGIVLVALVLVAALGLAACSPKAPTATPTPVAEATDQPTPQPTQAASKTAVNIAAIKGPTGIGLTKLMEANDAGTAANAYNFTLANGPDDVVGMVTSGEVDIAAVPSNLASTLYNKTQGKVQIAAINTLGVLYILTSRDDIQTLSDLEGKTLTATGQGATPEYVLNYILKQNGLEDKVTIEYKAEHSELATLAAAGEVDLCMLPEPNVTAVLMQNENMHIALDLTKEWEKATTDAGIPNSQLTMGVIIVNQEFAASHPEAMTDFLAEYKQSVEAVNANAQEAGALVEQYGIMPKAAAATKAIPNCNIVMIQGQDMVDIERNFLQILFDANPKAVGGAMPSEDFYYLPQATE